MIIVTYCHVSISPLFGIACWQIKAQYFWFPPLFLTSCMSKDHALILLSHFHIQLHGTRHLPFELPLLCMRSNGKRDLLCHIHLQALKLNLIAHVHNLHPLCHHCCHYQQDPHYIQSEYNPAWEQGYKNQSILCPCHHLHPVCHPF